MKSNDYANSFGPYRRKNKKLIRLRFVAVLGYREIGLVMHRKEDAVRKSISRLLVRLQNQLEEKND